MQFPFQVVAPHELGKLAARVERWPAVVLDVETVGVHPYIGAQLRGVGVGALGDGPEEYFYAPTEGVAPEAFAPLVQVLEHAPLLGHNIKFDLHMLAQGLGWCGEQERFFDLIVMARLFEHGERADLSLETLTQAYLGYHYETSAAKRIGKGEEVALEDIALKNVHDLRATRHLYYYFKEKLSPELLRLYSQECFITRDLFDMERRGELIDGEYLELLEGRLAAQIDSSLGEVRQMVADDKFNPNSAPQVGRLMKRLDIPVVERSKKPPFNPSWNKKAMLQVRAQHPAALAIAKHRALVHLESNVPAWCRATLKAGEPALHGTLKNWGTLPGRLASSDPNRQNDPHGWLQAGAAVEGDDVLRWAAGPEQLLSVERCFLARPGHVLVRADYRQIEMYVLGAYMQDPTFDRWLATGNVHAAVALELYGDAEKFYARGKTRNFAMIYGQGIKAEAVADKIGLDEVRRRREEYFKHMPGYPRFLGRVRRLLTRDGCVRNYFGREYWIDPERAYVGVNYLCQGSAGDFVKQRLPATRVLRRELGLHVIRTTHDDFTFEVPREALGEMPRLFAALIENPFERELGVDVELSEHSMVDMQSWDWEKETHATKKKVRRARSAA